MGGRKIRVLQVLGNLERGGVQTWLAQMLEYLPRYNIKTDILIHSTTSMDLASVLEAKGARLIPCTRTKSPRQYYQDFSNVIARFGPYDIVHSNVHYFSGIVMLAAYFAGVPVRVTHSRNTTVTTTGNIVRRAYEQVMRWAIRKYGTHNIAVSDDAARVLFSLGRNVRPYTIVRSGIDFSAFKEAVDPFSIRQELGIPRDAFVVGHVGRYTEQKNHGFLLRVAREVVKRKQNVYFLLVGTGKLRGSIEAQVANMGLSKHFVFVDARDDIPRLMKGAMDAFLFPSKWEGLGRVVLEAQAAGLPCVISDRVPADVAVVPALVNTLSLNQDEETWATTVVAALASPPPVTADEALQRLMSSEFDVGQNAKRLAGLYQEWLLSG